MKKEKILEYLNTKEVVEERRDKLIDLFNEVCCKRDCDPVNEILIYLDLLRDMALETGFEYGFNYAYEILKNKPKFED